MCACLLSFSSTEFFMTNAQMERELSDLTGESLDTIRHRGFQLVEPPELEPLIVNWDALDAERTSYLPQRSRLRRAA
jgi:hypothetical protein